VAAADLTGAAATMIGANRTSWRSRPA